MSYMAYNTLCADPIVDILYDLQDPITAVTPWIFGKIGTSMNYFITAADKTTPCETIFLTAPDCKAATFVNKVTLTENNPSNLQPLVWSFVYDSNIDSYYIKSVQTC